MRQLFRFSVLLSIIALTSSALAEETTYDPGQVSESLKAIFQLGAGSASTRQALNSNTVTLISGTIGGTYVQFGADLASVLDDGNRLRVLPIIGRGSVQSIADILFLKGVDLGIVRSDTLDYLEKKGFAKDIKKQFAYVTKLYNEEMHVIAPKSISSLKELDGKTVSVDLPNGGTFVTALIVFERLGIKPKFVYVEQRIAFEKMKGGEIDAVIAVQGKPSKFISQIKDDRLHLVPVDYAKSLQGDYLPASLSAKDYPNLVGEQEQVDTIAVPAVLAAYNWAPNTERYKKLELFVDAFFTKFSAFQNPPFHPKWKEVSLTAPLPAWQRFPPAQRWLEAHGAEPTAKNKFDEFLTENPQASRLQSEADKEALFSQYKAWEAARRAKPPRRITRPGTIVGSKMTASGAHP
jgi:TRAP transporter TAXI family solute receptor